MSDLNIPRHWVETKISDICIVIDAGSTPTPKQLLEKGEIQFLKVYNLNFDGTLNHENKPVYVSKETSEKILRRSISIPGDVLLNIVGPPFGKVSIIPEILKICNHNQAIVHFRVSKVLKNTFLTYWLRSEFMNQWMLRTSRRTSGQWNLSVNNCRSFNIPLPPLQEQERIVLKIDYCFQKINKTENALNEIEALLTKYRESILAKAFRGELISQNPKDEPASMLLEQIRAEQAKNLKSKKTEVPIFEKFLESDFNIPKTWVGLSFIDLVYLRARIGWKGLKAEEYTKQGPLFLSVREFNPDGTIDFDNSAHISEERYQESPEIMLQDGDVLLAKDGSTIGKVTIVSGLKHKATVNSSIAVMTPFPGVDSQYLFYYLKAPLFQSLVKERIQGAAIPHIFQKDLRALFIPLPPTNEQVRISKLLDKAFNEINETILAIEKKRKVLSALKISILNKAFEGSLVQKIDSEGSGHELLAKILGHKTSEGSVSRVNKKIRKETVRIKVKK